MPIDLTSPSLTVPLVVFGLLCVALAIVILAMIRDFTGDRLKYSKSLNPYKRARLKARQGDPRACLQCADMRAKGLGGARENPDAAMNYLYQAVSIYAGRARNGDGHAALKIAEIYNRGYTYPKMSKLADKAYRMALAINEENARRGDVNGFAFAGYQYRYGLGCVSDYDRAAGLLQRAADMGHGPSARSLAELYLNGLKPKPDPVTAARLVRQAAMTGDPEAVERVGDNHLDSMGEPASREQAYYWYSLAARKGRRDAMRKLEKLEQGWTPKQLRDVQARLETWAPA